MALYAAEKLLELGAIPLTFSDSSGHVLEPEVRQKMDHGCRFVLVRVVSVCPCSCCCFVVVVVVFVVVVVARVLPLLTVGWGTVFSLCVLSLMALS